MPQRPIFPSNSGDSSSSHIHANKEILDRVSVDSFGQLYYDTGYSLNDLKAGSILCLLGSTNDASGYNNNAISTGANYPTQVVGLNGQPALNFALNNSQLKCPNLQSSLAGSSGVTIYAVFQAQTSNFSLCEHTNTNQFDSWWRWDGDGRGYLGIFRNTRINQYPLNVSSGNWQCWAIFSRNSDYEVIINKVSQGIMVSGVSGVSGAYWQGNDFLISPNWRPFLGNLALLIIVPFWVDKTSIFHQAKMNAIGGRFSLFA